MLFNKLDLTSLAVANVTTWLSDMVYQLLHKAQSPPARFVVDLLYNKSTTKQQQILKSGVLSPLKGRDVNWLHLAISGLTYFLLSDIPALWRSVLGAREPECQEFKM